MNKLNTSPIPLMTGRVTTKVNVNPLRKKAKSGIASIQIAGILFVVIFTALLISNIAITSSLDADSSGINLAGRQRMLSQRITKSTNTLLSATQVQDLANIEKAQAEVKLSYNLFNDTLAAFRDGGITKGATGDPVELAAVPEGELRENVVKASTIWQPISSEILSVINASPESIDLNQLQSTTDLLAANNLTLLKLMNNLTVGLENSANEKSKLLQIILWSALVLVFVNFAYIVLYAVRSLKRRDAQLNDYSNNLENNLGELQDAYKTLETTQSELNESNGSLQHALESLNEASEQAHTRANELELISIDLNRLKEESDTIFNSVDHGLCLLDENFKIGSRVSLATYDIFETEHLSNMSFLDLMRPLITEKDLKTLESFLKLQFMNKTMNQQLDKYNPLKKIEVTLNWDGDKFSKKQLAFDFERIMEGEQIVAVLVTISDVTETVALENQLLRANDAQERKTNLLLEVITGDAQELKLFLGQTEATLDQINDSLKSHGVSSSDENLDSGKDLVEEVFRKIHNIKGNASMLGLTTVVNITHAVEDELAILRRKNIVQGEEFLNSLVELASLRERLNDYDEIMHTILKDFGTGGTSKATEAPAAKKLTKSEKLQNEIAEFNDKVAKDLGKSLFTHCNLEVNKLSPSGYAAIKDILIQLNRNVVAHGIESPEIRTKRGKLEQGAVTVLFKKDTSYDNILGAPAYQLKVRDDGAGLDLQKILDRAIELGMTTKKDSAKLTKTEIAKFIFKPEFSTTEEISSHSGRGVGLDIIKTRIVNTLGGKLSISFASGVYMQISCIIPATTLEQEASLISA